MSAHIPLVRASALHVAASFLARQGAPVERLLARANLSPWALEDAEALVPFAAITRFVEDAANIEGIEDLGIRIGLAMPVQRLGISAG